MNNMNQCKAQYKRERVRDSGSNANTKIYFNVRAPSSTSPPSHRKIFTNSFTQDFPHREPPLRIWANTTWEYTTPLLTNTTSTFRGKAQSQTRSTSQLRDTQSPLPQSPLTRGISTQSPFTRGISQSMEGYNTWQSLSTTNQFSHKIDPNRQDRQISSSVRK